MNADPYQGKSVVVVGYGITGKAVTEFLVLNGASVKVFYDGKINEMPNQLGFSIAPVDSGFLQQVELADVVVLSPGVPLSHPVFRSSVPKISELELAFRHSSTPMIAVTGTNGKTTVTTLVTEMLARAGFRAKAVGNIGTSIISMIGEELDFFVV